MGYDVHITRAEHWAENEGREIPTSEWHALVEADPELQLAGYNGPHFVVWNGHPADPEAWLDWSEGNITTKNPDPPLLDKMLAIAEQLGAIVQGDEGELYDGSPDPHVAWPPDHTGEFPRAPLISFLLALLSLLCLVILLPLDASIRRHYPVGTPMPLPSALLLAAIVMPGALGWLGGAILAIRSLILRQVPLRYAWSALVIDGVVATIVAVLD